MSYHIGLGCRTCQKKTEEGVRWGRGLNRIVPLLPALREISDIMVPNYGWPWDEIVCFAQEHSGEGHELMAVDEYNGVFNLADVDKIHTSSGEGENGEKLIVGNAEGWLK